MRGETLFHDKIRESPQHSPLDFHSSDKEKENGKSYRILWCLPFSMERLFRLGNARAWHDGLGMVGVGLIFVIRWLAGLSRSRAPYDKTHDSALEILKQRYAKGEINKDEFEEKKRDLM